MTYAIFDHKAIGASLRKASSLKTEPNTVHAPVYVPPTVDDYGMFAGMDANHTHTFTSTAPEWHAYWPAASHVQFEDTAPCEYLATSDFDPA